MRAIAARRGLKSDRRDAAMIAGLTVATSGAITPGSDHAGGRGLLHVTGAASRTA